LGDAEANRLAEELGAAQRQYANSSAGQLMKGGLLEAMYDAALTGHTSSLCGVFKNNSFHRAFDSGHSDVETSRDAVSSLQERLQGLSE
jgi:hypothetical protein